jgi:DNA-binding beta-propeller fold protein YncE
MVVNPAGTFAYGLCNSSNCLGSYPISGGVLTGETVMTGFGGGNEQVAITPNGVNVYVTCGTANTVAMFSVNGANQSLMGYVGTQSYPFGIAIHPWGNYVYVSNVNSNSIVVYSVGGGGALSTMTVVGTAVNPRSIVICKKRT